MTLAVLCLLQQIDGLQPEMPCWIPFFLSVGTAHHQHVLLAVAAAAGGL